MTEERAFWVAFNHIHGVGFARVQRMLKAFHTLQLAWEAPRSRLLDAGLDERTVESITTVRPKLDPQQLLDRYEKLGLRVVISNDPEYPVRLKELPAYPPVLYLRGKLQEKDNLAVAIVGTRRATTYGKEVARSFATALAASGITVISGLARGIDSQAHSAALDGGGRTIAVLGSGVDIIYPPEHDCLARIIRPGRLPMLPTFRHGTELSQAWLWRR
jgi:DNA processing protein